VICQVTTGIDAEGWTARISDRIIAKPFTGDLFFPLANFARCISLTGTRAIQRKYAGNFGERFDPPILVCILPDQFDQSLDLPNRL